MKNPIQRIEKNDNNTWSYYIYDGSISNPTSAFHSMPGEPFSKFLTRIANDIEDVLNFPTYNS